MWINESISFDASSNLIDGDLKDIYLLAKEINEREERSQCGLWTR